MRKIQLNDILRTSLAFMFLLTVSCGKNYSSLSPQLMDAENSQEVTDSPEIQEIQSEIDATVVESIKIEQEVQRIVKLSPTKIKLGNLKDLIKNFKSYFDSIKKMLEDLELKIRDQISRLDPNNPTHAKLIERLEKALEAIQKLKDRLNMLNFSVKDLIDQLLKKIEDKINQSGNPIISAILKMLLDVLKNEIMGKLP